MAPGTTKQRGYSGPHATLRARWKPQVDAGGVMCHAAICLKPSRWIAPGSKWHLGHTADRTGWTGPEHEQCSTSDGARRGNRRRGQRRAVSKQQASSTAILAGSSPLRTSRAW